MVYLDKAAFEALVTETASKLVKDQEHYVALVASKPETTISDVRLEVGKLYGIGLLMQALELEITKRDGEDN